MINLRNHSSKVFNLITAIILTSLCLLLAKLTQINFHKLELPKDKPEFSATGVTATIYESTGKIVYYVVANKAIEYPDSKRILFEKLVFNSYDSTKQNLVQQLFSDDGYVDTDKQSAYLGNAVKLINFAKFESQNIILTTHAVNIDTKTKLISTKSAINATQGQSVMNGIGATFDYDKQFLTIESQVRITYVTNQ